MKQLVSLVAVVACLWSASAAGQDLADHPEVASQIKLMDAWIQAQMKDIDLPGLVIGVVHDQEVVWSKAYGHADVERDTPMQSDSIFRIASHSKLFTSIAILQLRDAGKLRLDDPITDHLPWFDMQNPYPEAEPVRIWNLLTHSAGLPRESDHPSWTEFEFPTGEDLRETVSQQQAAYPAATVWKYSNLGLSLAGAIVETVSGREYEEYVETEIMAPLGMTSSSVGVPSDVHRVRLVTGYGRRWPDKPREAMPFIDARAFDPATGLSSSVEDMLRFLSWQMRLRAEHVTEVLPVLDGAAHVGDGPCGVTSDAGCYSDSLIIGRFASNGVPGFLNEQRRGSNRCQGHASLFDIAVIQDHRHSCSCYRDVHLVSGDEPDVVRAGVGNGGWEVKRNQNFV